VILRAVSGETVRDATFEVLREQGLTTIFGNPGSTEVPFLTDFPQDLRFVLGLHEGSVVGLATGWAIGRGDPALALLHTTAGLGNAVGALASANRIAATSPSSHSSPASSAGSAGSIWSGSRSPFVRRTSPARSAGRRTRPRRSAARLS
jgi:hypothetical protein